MKKQNVTAILYALAAAVFYALNVPCSKVLLGDIASTMLAALLYLGAGLGVGLMYLPHRRKEAPEDRLSKKDLPYTVGMVLLDTAAPILLMAGVSIGTSANASLLGNFEIAATTIIAMLVFQEKVSKRLWTAIGLITASSLILSFEGADAMEFSLGSLLVLGATVCWGLENNCTRNISGKSTYQIVTIKGLFSGMGSLVIALLLGERLPGIPGVLAALALGYVAYGLSIFTYIRAQNTLGAAKTSAYYAFAPFIGSFLSFALLKERLSPGYVLALLIMLIGTGFAVYDTLLQNHSHAHTHVLVHTHDGTTHSHTVVHCHTHNHLVSAAAHSHHHSKQELERSLSSSAS